MRHLKTLVSITALFAALNTSVAKPANGHGDAASCRALAGRPVAPNTARGGKFIFFQGWADSVITPMMDVDFYARIVARYGQAKTDDFFRFFLLPGMGHCSGGPGFSHIGGATGTPVKDDPDHDMVKALDQWVTKNQAPSLFIGAHVSGEKDVTATRPICRYPLDAAYTGRGDSSHAENFTCRAPSKM
jgi:feruloyl esterase